MITMRENLLGYGVSIYNDAWIPEVHSLFTDDFIKTISTLHRKLEPKRQQILGRRRNNLNRPDHIGQIQDSPQPKNDPRTDHWQSAPLPDNLKNRKVEMIGPSTTVRNFFSVLKEESEENWPNRVLLDLEETLRPTWTNLVKSYQFILSTLREGPLSKDNTLPQSLPETGVRIRGLKLNESNLQIDGEKICAGLLDLAICLFHLDPQTLKEDCGILVTIPKCEDPAEAAWWNEACDFLEKKRNHLMGRFRLQLIIENLEACWNMEEMLFHIRDRAAGLSLGRPSKFYRNEKVLKDPKTKIPFDLTKMENFFIGHEALIKNLVTICHSRNTLALSESSLSVPFKDQEQKGPLFDKIQIHLNQHLELGLDGLVVFHPGMVAPTLKAFSAKDNHNKIWEEQLEDKTLLRQEKDFKEVPLNELLSHIRLAIIFQHAWNKGHGQISLDTQIHDVSSLEHARSQIWRGLYHGLGLSSGEQITESLIKDAFEQEGNKLLKEIKGREKGTNNKKTQTTINEWINAKDEAKEFFLWDIWDETTKKNTELAPPL